MGDYTESTDYPPNLLTENERKELQEGLNESESWDNDYEYLDDSAADFVSKPINLYFLAQARYQPIKKRQCTLSGTPLIEHARKAGVWHGLSDFRKSQIWDEFVGYGSSDSYPEDQSWILRNL